MILYKMCKRIWKILSVCSSELHRLLILM